MSRIRKWGFGAATVFLAVTPVAAVAAPVYAAGPTVSQTALDQVKKFALSVQDLKSVVSSVSASDWQTIQGAVDNLPSDSTTWNSVLGNSNDPDLPQALADLSEIVKDIVDAGGQVLDSQGNVDSTIQDQLNNFKNDHANVISGSGLTVGDFVEFVQGLVLAQVPSNWNIIYDVLTNTFGLDPLTVLQNLQSQVPSLKDARQTVIKDYLPKRVKASFTDLNSPTITYSGSSIVVPKGVTLKPVLKLDGTPVFNGQVLGGISWSSDTPAITVDSSGFITVNGPGTLTAKKSLSFLGSGGPVVELYKVSVSLQTSGGGGGGGGGGTPAPPSPPPSNGGSVVTPSGPVTSVTTGDGQVVSSVDVTAGDLSSVLGNPNVKEIIVNVPQRDNAKGAQANLTLDTLNQLQQSARRVLTIRTAVGALTVPADAVTKDVIAGALGVPEDRLDATKVKVSFTVSLASDARSRQVSEAAQRGGLPVIAPVLNFSIQVTFENGKAQELTNFGNHYIVHQVPLQDRGVPAGQAAGVMVVGEGDRTAFVPAPTVVVNGVAKIMVPHDSTYTVVKVNRSFADVPGGYWGADFIGGLANRLVVVGYPDGKFYPDRPITRAEFATILVRSLGLEPVNGSPFPDVEQSAWYGPYVGAAVKAGLVHGYTDGTFRPSAQISREEAAQMLYNAEKFLKTDTGVDRDRAVQAVGRFTDGKNVSTAFVDAVGTLTSQGLIKGYPDGSFQPAGKTTRAEMSTLVYKLLKLAGLIN
ncbi:MAG: S-layer homology domain-containing protein [Alicyclobacillaceae bacterium]|nr:S-layer homology domain-containing protein [Alicyclobacillaceae bacterium]